jgi:hypothetical protein
VNTSSHPARHVLACFAPLSLSPSSLCGHVATGASDGTVSPSDSGTLDHPAAALILAAEQVSRVTAAVVYSRRRDDGPADPVVTKSYEVRAQCAPRQCSIRSVHLPRDHGTALTHALRSNPVPPCLDALPSLTLVPSPSRHLSHMPLYVSRQSLREISRVCSWCLFSISALECEDYQALKALSPPLAWTPAGGVGTIAGILPPGIVQSMRACARDIAVLRLARRFRRNTQAGSQDGVAPAGPGPHSTPGSASGSAVLAAPNASIAQQSLLMPFMEPVLAPGGGSEAMDQGVVVVDTNGTVVSVSVGLLHTERGGSVDAAAAAAARAADEWLSGLVRVCMRYLLADALCNTLATIAKAVASVPGEPHRPALSASRRLLGDLCVALDAWRKDALAEVNACGPPKETWALMRAMDPAYRT